jgi:hypothetical protein
MEYHYHNLLHKLNLLKPQTRSRHSDDLFLINVLSGHNCCPFILETLGIRVPTRNIQNSTTYYRLLNHPLPFS